jgi:CubicO group peptidase (beta-lactamase class C family)
MHTLSLFSILGLSVLVLSSCGSDPNISLDGTEDASGSWENVSPADVGADEALLAAMIEDIENGRYANLHSVLVIKDGRPVLEEYFDGHHARHLHEIRSATKVIGSILTGIAIDKGFISSETVPISKYFENDYLPADGWSKRSRQVEIHHLLSMMSGYECDDLRTAFACEHAMYESGDWVQYALDLPFGYDPGEHWAYNSSSLILIGEAIARASGLELRKFAEHHLFRPLGIKDFRWTISPKGRAWVGGSARMTTREMAKIGLLMLNRGVWNDRRILSEEWIDKSTARQGEMRGGVDYGYAWQRSEAVVGSRLVPAYWASGNGGQYIIVFPEDDMVVVFTGGNYDSPLSNQPFQMLLSHILPAFLEFEEAQEIKLEPEELQRFTGVYELDFEPATTSTVTVHKGRLRVLTPDGEAVDLVAHSPTRFSGDSQYGPVTFIFDADEHGETNRFVVYGSFSRFAFERQSS